MEAVEEELMISSKTSQILQEQIINLEKEIVCLEKAKAELQAILVEDKESVLKGYIPDKAIGHTGKYWYANRFSPELGYSTINFGFRILYESQDEEPNFIPGTAKNRTEGKAEVWSNIDEARKYIKNFNDKSSIYTIVAADGEIVV